MTTPSHPTPARRRATGIRRPRVAGHTPGRPAPATTAPAAEAPPEPAARRAVQRPSGKRALRRRMPTAEAAGSPTTAAARAVRRPVRVPVLVGTLVVLVGLAVFFGVENAEVRGTPSAQNTALVDIGTTAQVSQEVTAALKTVYSFDYTRLDENEAAARAVITPAFADQFDQLFRQVRELAPQQQAVVTATVNLVGVQSIDGDTATLLVFLDQQATRAQSGGAPQQLAAAGRLVVTAQLVDGTWKIAAVDPR
jgi:Mce-associated membrane protein